MSRSGFGQTPWVIVSKTKARLAVSTVFLLLGAMMGTWASRIPGVRAQVGVDDAHWGLIILASPVGTLAALVLVTRLIPRTGALRLTLPGAVGVLLAVPTTAAAQQIWLLVLALLVQGAASGLLVTPMNALAVLVERRYPRRIMSTFHACFSGGQLVGGGLGALSASHGISPRNQLLVTGAVLALALAGTARWLPRDKPAPTSAAAPVTLPTPDRPRRFSTVTPQLALLAAIALLSSISEGAAVQWSAEYGAVTLAAGAGVGALTFTCFSVAMTVSRTFGDRIVNAVGRIRFLRLASLVAAAGMAVGLTVGTTAGGFVGFALLGVGCACLVPTVMGLAGNQPGLSAGRGVAVVGFGQWPAFLIGPPLIGAVAGLVGLRLALGVTVLGALTVAVLAGRVREPRAAAVVS